MARRIIEGIIIFSFIGCGGGGGSDSNSPFCGGNGTSSGPYQICTVTQFEAINDYGNANPVLYFELANDLDFSGQRHEIYDVTFYHVLDGKNHALNNVQIYESVIHANSGTIKNLTLNITSAPSLCQGFVNDNSGTIQNIHVTGTVTNCLSAVAYTNDSAGTLDDVSTDLDFTSGATSRKGGIAHYNYGLISNCTVDSDFSGTWVGGVAPHNESTGIIQDCDVQGDIVASDIAGGIAAQNTVSGANRGLVQLSSFSGTISGQKEVGGIVASNLGDIKSSTSSGTITTTGAEEAGGIVGVNGAFSNIETSISTATVSSAGDAGGIAGYNGETIYYSYASGAVSTTSATYDAGGLVGKNDGTISKSFAKGNVTAVTYAGGLAGMSYNGSTIAYSYARGDTAATTRGGLAARTSGIVTVVNSYWNTSSNNVASAAGTGLSSAQFSNSANLTGWDFTNDWYYPPASLFPELR